jgi:hypothetical protein
VFNANNTYNIGSTGAYASNLYASTTNYNSTASMTGATAGTINVNTGSLGILATSNSATHSLTLGSTATGIALYNTSDQTTNYERLFMGWNSNAFQITAQKAGTGTSRDLQILSAQGSKMVLKGIGGNIQFTGTFGSGNTWDFGFVTFNGSSGTSVLANLSPTINQSSTAGYTALLVNPTETSTGSGTNLLIDAHVGAGAGFKVDNGGYATFQGAFSNGDITAHNIILASNNTYSIGSPSAYASNLYATTLNLNSTASLSGGASGQITVTGQITSTTSGGNVSIYNNQAGSGLILQGNGGTAGTALLRIVANGGAWTDNVNTAYFQINPSGGGKYVTFQSGTYGTDTPFDRLQFLSRGTSFSDGGYGSTPVPTAILEVVNGTDNLALKVKGYSTQTHNLQEWQNSSSVVLTKVDGVGLFYPVQAPTASAPSYVKGALYFDTTLNKLRVGGASGWETVTSS